MLNFKVKTGKKREVISLNSVINSRLKDVGIRDGLCNIFVAHTTCAITTADLDPGTDLDMLDSFYEMVPKLKYRHPHNPEHAPDHILSSLIGTSLAVPVKNMELVLGMWQEVVLIEFDGPRERSINLNLIPDKDE